MKVIISKNILTELKIYPNQNITKGSFSDVYVGNKWVKKISRKKNGYSQEELDVFELMEIYPNFFAETKIINKKLVIQKKLDTKKIESFFSDLQITIQFIDFLEKIFEKGFWENKEQHDFFLKLIEPELKTMFNKFVQFAIEFNQKLYRRFKSISSYHPDINSGNWGMDGDNLKLLDI